MLSPERIARFFKMDDEAWRRHANPWSVHTRFAAIPAMILAIWSRVWIGWWALGPVAAVLVWLWVNPRAFAPVDADRGWAARGIYGERFWLENRLNAPGDFRALLRWLIVLGLIGFVSLAWGLVALLPWPTIYGATLLIVAQLWRIDRMGLLYEESRRALSDERPDHGPPLPTSDVSRRRRIRVRLSRGVGAVSEQLGLKALHDGHEGFALLLGSQGGDELSDPLAEHRPCFGQGDTDLPRHAGQPTTALNEVPLAVRGHARQADNENAEPDLLDQPAIMHQIHSKPAPRRRQRNPFRPTVSTGRELACLPSSPSSAP